MYIDSHAHLLKAEFGADLEAEIQCAKNAGVSFVNNIGYDPESSEEAVELSSKYGFLFASVGVHPYDVDKCNEDTLKKLESLANNEKTIAIGEIGLDYFRKITDFELQKECFRKQIELAKSLDMPFIVHSRDAFSDTFSIIKESDYFNGVFHSFDYGTEEAKIVLDSGMFISFSGMLTFKKKESLRKAAQYVPLDRILFETDSPYLAPVPVRGKRNNPEYVKYVYALAAKIKNIGEEDLCEAVKGNFQKLFPKSMAFFSYRRKENV